MISRKGIGVGFAVFGGLGFLCILLAAGRGRSDAAKEATMQGKIVDLQSFMTGKFAGDDPVRATQQAIRAGTPAALETEDGLIILGQGQRGPMRTLMPLAMREVEVKGMLYEKHGLQYMDITSISRAARSDEEEEGEHPAEGEPGYDPDGPPDE
jgi:hypothetical protein